MTARVRITCGGLKTQNTPDGFCSAHILSMIRSRTDPQNITPTCTPHWVGVGTQTPPQLLAAHSRCSEVQIPVTRCQLKPPRPFCLLFSASAVLCFVHGLLTLLSLLFALKCCPPLCIYCPVTSLAYQA